MPIIPGYLEPQDRSNLRVAWQRPAGDYPDNLWPAAKLREIESRPSGWVTVVEHFFTDDAHGGTGCVLVPSDELGVALAETSWTGRSLGTVEIWDSGRFETGLFESESPHAEFFAHARHASGAKTPQFEVAHQFLWYWDAFQALGGWKYLNRAGREQDLLRIESSEDAWKVQVRALELRTFLHASGRSALIQVDLVLKSEAPEFDRVDDEYISDWAHLDFHVLRDESLSGPPAFSRLMGQFAIAGQRTSRLPRWEERLRDREYPSFIYGIDAETGEPRAHSCDPNELGTYFDKDGTRLHYLTPIYFKREVLHPYAAEPGRYSISASRLSCLDLWGLDISFNSAGLIEVYLGDLGRDLPSDEWGHWRTYNVLPVGRMDEGRFRRDFLNQPSSSMDPIGDLRRGRAAVNAVATKRLGLPLWRPLPPVLEIEYQSLIGPLTDDPAALSAPLLLLTKVFVDALDPGPLKKALGQYEKGEQSLRLLQRYLESLGDEADTNRILRDLQSFRSRGGIAHIANSESPRAAATLGIEGLGATSAFALIVTQISAAMGRIRGLFDPAPSVSEGDGMRAQPRH